MENDKSTKNKRIFKGILVAALALCSIYSWTLPISSNFCKLSWIMKAWTGGSILCGLAFYVIVIALSVKNGKKNKKYYYDILYASPLLVLETLNVLAIFDYEIWGYKASLAGLALLLIMFLESFTCIRVVFKKSFGHENVPVFLLSIGAISGFITFVSIYSGNVEYTDFFAKAGVGLVYLVGVALYIHQFIYKPKKPEKIISNIIFIVLFGAPLTLLFPYYIQWCGLSGENFNTFVTVYAAVIGGALTLAGVAWTINDANNKRNDDIKRIEEQRKEDLERIENDRKEEERRKYRPIIHVFAGSYSGMKTDIDVFSWLYDTDKISKTATKTLTVASRIHSCYFGNTDFSNVYVWGIKINGHMTHFSSIRYVKKEHYFYLDFSDKSIYTEKPIETISLILEDVLENLYELPLEHTFSDSFKWYIIQGNNPSVYIGKVKKEDNYEQHID